jgi:hypothetical protein
MSCGNGDVTADEARVVNERLYVWWRTDVEQRWVDNSPQVLK